MFNNPKQKFINFAALHRAADGLIGRIPPVKKRRRLKQAYKVFKYFCLAIISLFLILLILLTTQILSLKQIYDQANFGKVNLEQAVAYGQADNFSQAASLAQTAKNNFNFSLQGLERLKENYFINRLPWALSQLNDASNLLISAQFLSQAVYGGANLGQSLEAISSLDKKLSFSNLSTAEKRGLLKKIFEAAPELNGIKADLDLAYINLEQVKLTGLLFPLNNKINQLKEQINQASLILEQAIPLSQLLPALAGYPNQANYLLILQNNDELRPTGGFLGTYGILRLKDGEIASLKTHDVYHLDMPVQDKINITPPPPIKKYLVDKWYLRDSNWSPDWPTAARKIVWFYQLESGLNQAAEKIPEFDGVIAITPKLITDFLKITGPITIEGQAYNQDNFQDLLQYRVEKGYQVLGVSSWQRKEVIGAIAEQLKINIFALPPDKWSEIINLAINNLTAKNLLLYLTDNQLENIAIQNGWGGEIKKYNSDYLMVVDANLGALKTDAVMNRSLNYKVTQGANGLFSKLTLNYAHNGKPDWKTGTYKSYTRIYAPLGSQLIRVNGYLPGQVDTGFEAGKTWFGFYFEVLPGKIKNLTIEYKLPSLILWPENYGLYIQKQTGKEINQAVVDLSFLNDIKSYSPASLYMQKAGSGKLKWEGDLNIDRSFEVNF